MSSDQGFSSELSQGWVIFFFSFTNASTCSCQLALSVKPQGLDQSCSCGAFNGCSNFLLRIIISVFFTPNSLASSNTFMLTPVLY